MSDRGRIYGGRPERERRYVDVVSRTQADGLVTPLEIVWEDGRRFRIERVCDRRPARSLKTGGTGMRFTVQVRGVRTHLYFDDERGAWFVEAKVRANTDWGA